MMTEEKIVKVLLERGWKVATAESCTGGMIASKLVNVSGVSEAFDEGYITYANSAKVKLLGVKPETLREHGAVSEETAMEMAAGAAKASGADCSVVTTGIAGPGGGTPEKPVGLVYMATCVKGKVSVKRCLFDGSRIQVREQASETALKFLLQQITEEEVN